MASHPDAARKLRWGRALVAAILGEVVLILIAIPFYGWMGLGHAASLLSLIVPPASFVVFVGAGYWSAKRTPSSAVLQGALTGVIAVLAYLAIGLVASLFVAGTSVAAGFTPAYLTAHALKIIGGAVGGWLASRRASPAS